MTRAARRRHTLFLGAFLAAGCASAPSADGPAGESASAVPAPDSGLRYVTVDIRGLRIMNMHDFNRTLARELPAELLEAGVEGYATVWLHVNESGQLLDRKLHTTSGNDKLDRVILSAARVLRFSAEGRSDPVWIGVDLGYGNRGR